MNESELNRIYVAHAQGCPSNTIIAAAARANKCTCGRQELLAKIHLALAAVDEGGEDG